MRGLEMRKTRRDSGLRNVQERGTPGMVVLESRGDGVMMGGSERLQD